MVQSRAAVALVRVAGWKAEDAAVALQLSPRTVYRFLAKAEASEAAERVEAVKED